MAFEHKEGYGAIFKDNKKQSENGPDYRGNVMVGGVVYELAGWIKTGGKGPFLSLKAQLPRDQQQSKPAAQQRPRDEDSIPF